MYNNSVAQLDLLLRHVIQNSFRCLVLTKSIEIHWTWLVQVINQQPKIFFEVKTNVQTDVFEKIKVPQTVHIFSPGIKSP